MICHNIFQLIADEDWSLNELIALVDDEPEFNQGKNGVKLWILPISLSEFKDLTCILLVESVATTNKAEDSESTKKGTDVTTNSSSSSDVVDPDEQIQRLKAQIALLEKQKMSGN